jgi:hypothetical protein
MGIQQFDLLKELAKAFEFLNKNNYPIKFQAHIIRGNYPFNSIKVTDLITNTTYDLEGENVIQYLMVNEITIE